MYRIDTISANEVIAYTGTAGNSTANTDWPHGYRIVATSDCHVAVGVGVTATTSDMFLPANTIAYINIGKNERLSVVQEDAAGSLHLTQVA